MKLDFNDTNVGGFHYELIRGLGCCGSGGAELGEYMYAVGNITNGDFTSWTAEWATLAERIFHEAEEQESEKQDVSAKKLYLRASNYYRMAAFYAHPHDTVHREAWKQSRECFIKAASCIPHPVVDVLEIDFEGGKLPGYFIHAQSKEGKRPTIVALGGFDSTAEELYHWIGVAASEREWHCLIFEGPGQPGAVHTNPGLLLRPDYEVPVKAVIDFAEARYNEHIDFNRLALIGYSLGGYLAPRAFAFEKRLKACIANSPVVDIGEAFQAAWPSVLRRLPPRAFNSLFSLLSRSNTAMHWAYTHATWAMGIHNPHEFIRAWAAYSLKGLEERYDRPMLFLIGEDEIAQTSKTLTEKTERYVRSLHCDKTVHIFTREEGAAAHCQAGEPSKAHSVIFPWLESIFGVADQTKHLEPLD
jgi:pimeloyl-ACP methyl ester carboxylesterase